MFDNINISTQYRPHTKICYFDYFGVSNLYYVFSSKYYCMFIVCLLYVYLLIKKHILYVIMLI